MHPFFNGKNTWKSQFSTFQLNNNSRLTSINYRNPLQAPYTGPYKVVSKQDKTFVIDMGGRQVTISIDCLKPAHIDASAQITLAQPPRRGRPHNYKVLGTPH